MYLTIGAMVVGLVLLFFIGRSLRKQRKAKREKQFTAAFPRNSGACSAVVGGDPEDINQMPATEDPKIEGPIYDGSQLPRTHSQQRR